MGSYRRFAPSAFGRGGYVPSGVKWLLIINFTVFVLAFFLGLLEPRTARMLPDWFGLQAAGFFRGMLWQPFTYLFLHGDFWHILFNMLTLWMFGVDLERDWGRKSFLRYYFVSGVGAGICVVVVNLLWGSAASTTIGSSGAIYGILLAFGLLYPTRTVYFSFLFPIQARYFVLIMGVIAFMSSFNQQSPVSNVAHLGGMIFGYVYLRYRLHQLRFNLRGFYQQWRRRRLQRKFQVYMRKRGQDPGRWVN